MTLALFSSTTVAPPPVRAALRVLTGAQKPVVPPGPSLAPAVSTARTAATAAPDDGSTKQRLAAKDQARQRVQMLVQRMRTLKQFASDDPAVMAKQLAQIVKELKSALKAYAAAGGSPANLSGTAPTTGAASSTPETQTVEKPAGLYGRMLDQIKGSEAAGDMTFVREARDFGKAIRDLLTKAKIQTALKGPDDETRKAFEDTEEGLKEIDKTLDDMDRDIRASSPAAGLFVALFA